MMKTKRSLLLACGLAVATVHGIAPFLLAAETCGSADNPYLGRWALTLPGGGAGWLGVEQQANGSLRASVLWGGGSVVPAAETRVADGILTVIRKHNRKKEGRQVQHIQTLTAKRDGRTLALRTVTRDETGTPYGEAAFRGDKIPELPAKPDLAALTFGQPIPLIAENSLSGWQVMNPRAPNCWRVTAGVLSNRVKGPDGKNRHGTNLRTDAVFEDFNLKTEVRVPKGGNSGIYLRGIYEVQVMESHGRPVDSHHMGALYSRITPAVAAEKPADTWQTLDITLADRHLTVILNGKTIIDNQPVLGCTGGAMTSDEFRPGPIYLQGDHTDVDYRNMVLTPIVK